MTLKQKRALTIMAGWLEAAGVPFALQGKTGFSIAGKAGQFDVSIDEGACSPIQKGLEAFWTITDKAGYGKPQILKNRDPNPKKIKPGTSPELVAMRHREYRSVAGLPSHVYHDIGYQKIVSLHCSKFFNSNRELCFRMGYEVSDIKTYGMLYLTNFYGKWRHLDAGADENQKMFCSYLKQRLYCDLKSTLVLKAKNTSVDVETAQLGQDLEYLEQFSQGHKESVAVSRVEQSGQIYNMEHNKLIRVIKAKARRGNKEAKMFLVLHRKNCLDCCWEYKNPTS